VDAEFAHLYPTAPNADLAKRYGRSVVTILKWARRLGVRKDPAYRRTVQAANASRRRLTDEQKERLRLSAIGRKMSPETKAKIIETKRRRGTILRGARHPFWKGGRPWERFKDPRYVAWRNAVLERDNYVCQHCGRRCAKHERGLAAHHIMAYATNPLWRYDLSNGMTLCRACHMDLHGRALGPVARVLCACGCGTEIDAVDRYGRPRRFVNHHAGRQPRQPRGATSADAPRSS